MSAKSVTHVCGAIVAAEQLAAFLLVVGRDELLTEPAAGAGRLLPSRRHLMMP